MSKPRPKPFLVMLIFFFSLITIGSAQWMEEMDDEVDVIQSRPGQGSYMKGLRCDLSDGEWVHDWSYPLYRAGCPYISSGLSCWRNGRPDSDYEKWRWSPHGCSMPRFNALDFLEKLRRKRLMMVGDSIARNQWESLVCLVEGVIPSDRKVMSYNGTSMAFHALDFEASIEFDWAPLLVELEQGPNTDRILRLDSIERNARTWRGVHILVFDSAHWWTHSGKWSSWDLYMEDGRLVRDMNPMVAYEKGLTTWAKWVSLNLNPTETRIIFRSASARHNRDNGWQCYNQKEPLQYLGSKARRIPVQTRVLKDVLNRMSFPVYLQEITAMSSLRRDGHPSAYAEPVYDSDPGSHASDCTHWCLPGVPDSWNEMLYALLL
ncbi:hypothetical protein QJS10_CPA02g00967 [Acorus calamus]|uniref:Trichome birefringence-like N-terminal domain-containing protein n=1 Tax=Acorus calamus TaxID=4465 RepID=A0AAV9FEI4_ACOCL|nr:hypothetical protein QJS10_CPA02g00967 [Acorus calamus]